VPINLKVYYVFHPISSLLTTLGAISLVVTLTFAIGVLVCWGKNKLIFFNLMIIVIPLLPVLYIPALGDNTFTERYLYLPSLGFVLLVALLIGRIIELKPRTAKALLVSLSGMVETPRL
jgi:hypothetical protein